MTPEEELEARWLRLENAAAVVAAERNLIDSCPLCKLNSRNWDALCVWLNAQPNQATQLEERKDKPYVAFSCPDCGYTLTFACCNLLEPATLERLVNGPLDS